MNIMREQQVERRAHVKEQAAADHQLLAKEAETTIMYLNAVEKPPKISPKDFGIPTDFLSKLPSHALKNIFHEDCVDEYLITPSASQLHQSHLTVSLAKSTTSCPPVPCLVWPNGLSINCDGFTFPEFSVKHQLDKIHVKELKMWQETELQCIINTIQNMSISWHNLTRNMKVHKHPKLNPDVLKVMLGLVQIELEKLMDSFHQNSKGPVADPDCMDVKETHDDNMSGHSMKMLVM
ncbi:hypothetical protein BKA82DRAFT_4010407 [Pisolithus tinctorius]|nr:hypothetical protein BKA82DRAFT_4010407 [Pisolithus tinctorius]